MAEPSALARRAGSFVEMLSAAIHARLTALGIRARHLRRRQRRGRAVAGLAPLVALLIASCGSGAKSHTGSGPSGARTSSSTPTPARTTPARTTSSPCPPGVRACITFDPSVPVVGPRVLGVNIEQLMAQSQRYLKQPIVTCPSSTAFPVNCTMTATDTTKGRAGPVKGTVTVKGIFTGTHTYVYQLLYAPSKQGRATTRSPGAHGT